MRRRWRAVTLLLCCFLLVACSADVPTSHPATAFNGRWVGFFESSLGLLGCPTRAPMLVIFAQGRIDGDAEAESFAMSVGGVVEPDGAIRDGVFRRDARAAAIMTGTFLDNGAAGRWQRASCEGVWSLRRVAR